MFLNKGEIISKHNFIYPISTEQIKKNISNLKKQSKSFLFSFGLHFDRQTTKRIMTALVILKDINKNLIGKTTVWWQARVTAVSDSNSDHDDNIYFLCDVKWARRYCFECARRLDCHSLMLMRISCSLTRRAPGCLGLASRSTSTPAGGEKVKFCRRAAEKMYSSILDRASPRQLLRPVPKGMNPSFGVLTLPSWSRNRSGRNSCGWSQ